MNIRVGQGFDVHRWVEGRPLKLGGIHIPHGLGLLGHSDADVLLHAIIDALLGAAKLGDIGRRFPDNMACYANIDSRMLLADVGKDLKKAGWIIENLDATVICEKPRLAPHIPAMEAAIAEVLGLSPLENRVSVKATTTEGLGFTGRGEGVAAQAVVLVTRNRS